MYCLNDAIHNFERLDAEKSECEININELSLVCPYSRNMQVILETNYYETKNVSQKPKI